MLEEGWMPEDLDNKTFDVIWSGQIQTFQGLVVPSHSWVLEVWHQEGAWGLAAKNAFNVLIFDVNGPVTKSGSTMIPYWQPDGNHDVEPV